MERNCRSAARGRRQGAYDAGLIPGPGGHGSGRPARGAHGKPLRKRQVFWLVPARPSLPGAERAGALNQWRHRALSGAGGAAITELTAAALRRTLTCFPATVMNWPSAGERVSGGGALTVSWRKGTKKNRILRVPLAGIFHHAPPAGARRAHKKSARRLVRVACFHYLSLRSARPVRAGHVKRYTPQYANPYDARTTALGGR